MIDARVNEALERLMDGYDWECLRRVMRLTVRSKTVVLPANVEKILWVDTDGTPGKLFGQAYQFLSSGVGDLDYGSIRSGSGYKDAVDLGGHWSVMYTIPPEAGDLPLIALSDSAADSSQVTVQGRCPSHRTQTDTLDIQALPEGTALAWSGTWDGDLVTLTPGDKPFSHIDRVVKEVTEGTVSLVAVDEAAGRYYKLAVYYPKTVRPQFRRYQLTNFHPVEGRDSACDTTDVLALVRLRYVPLVEDTDEAPIDSIQAIKLMVIAIREENAGNLQGAVNYEEKALRVLTDREKTRTISDGTPVILNHDYRASMGRRLNRRGLIL